MNKTSGHIRREKIYNIFSKNLELLKAHPKFDLKGEKTSGYICPLCNKIFDKNGDGWDNINNVENVYISPKDVEFGAYTVSVKGHNIPADSDNDGQADQDFAVTAYNVQSEPTKDGEIQINKNEYRESQEVKIKLADMDLKGEGTYEINITSIDEEGNLFSDNDERAIFFAKGVIETVKKLKLLKFVEFKESRTNI